ncbi:PTS sugar transporter subunit IIA [Mycoplasmopsis cynos]|uniref:PTS sugar transporter subunit IIA n=1 Tax=Mycoplasmopsis cynos TaxID=171284 RepID=UPI002FEF6611
MWSVLHNFWKFSYATYAQSDAGVKENSFSLITLKSPVYFEGDERPVRVLIALAATSAEIHTSEALPQIVAIFEDNNNLEKIINAKTSDEIIEIISKIDFQKYLI